MLKKILLSLASAVLLWQSYSLLIVIDKIESNSFWLLLFVAWIVNLFITGVFAFAGFAWPTQKAIPASYYIVKDTKRIKQVYTALRVDLFRKILLATLWKSEKQRAKHFDGKRSGITNLIVQSQKSEFGHLVPFVIACFVSLYLIGVGQYKLSALIFVVNIIGNLYPVLLQRHHRMRIQAIAERHARRAV